MNLQILKTKRMRNKGRNHGKQRKDCCRKRKRRRDTHTILYSQQSEKNDMIISIIILCMLICPQMAIPSLISSQICKKI